MTERPKLPSYAALVNYFAIFEYSEEEKTRAKLVFRCPQNNYGRGSLMPDFTPNLDITIQPEPWEPLGIFKPPTFMLNQVTEASGLKQYMACLTFYEATVQHGMTSYVPKALVMLSNQQYFTAFRAILNIIYTAAVYEGRSEDTMYQLISNTLNFYVHQRPETQYISIGSIDRIPLKGQLITFVDETFFSHKRPQSLTLPKMPQRMATSRTCYDLLRQLGAKDLATLVVCALTSRKIVVLSQSFRNISDTFQAIQALIYPFEYCGFCVPIVSSEAPLDILVQAPGCWLLGVPPSIGDTYRTTFMNEHVVVADIDGGRLQLPPEDQHAIASYCEHTSLKTVIKKLSNILFPQLPTADHAFIDHKRQHRLATKSQQLLDKEIRTIFIDLWLLVFKNYRNHLRIIRTHPQIITRFDSDGFLQESCSQENRPLLREIIASQEWTYFLEKRGSPYRATDIFDDFIVNEKPQPTQLTKQLYEFELGIEEKPILPKSIDRFTEFINELENKDFHTTVALQKLENVLKPFPTLNSEACDITWKVNYEKSQREYAANYGARKLPEPGYVPAMVIPDQEGNVIKIDRKRLTIAEYVNEIFSETWVEAKKLNPAIKRLMSRPMARTVLLAKLNGTANSHGDGNIVIDFEAFSLLADVLNECLKMAKSDGNGSLLEIERVASELLPTITRVYRKLPRQDGKNLIDQYLYTAVQEHDVWFRESFWSGLFEQTVQDRICRIHLPDLKERVQVVDDCGDLPEDNETITEVPASNAVVNGARLVDYTKYDSRYGMAIVATIIKSVLEAENNKETANEEMRLIFAETVNLASMMVYMLWPLETGRFGNILAKKDRLLVRRSRNAITHETAASGGTFERGGALHDANSDLRSVGSRINRRDMRLDKVNEAIAKNIKKYIQDLTVLSKIEHKEEKKLFEMIDFTTVYQRDNLSEVRDALQFLKTNNKQSNKALVDRDILLLAGEVILRGGDRDIIQAKLENGAFIDNASKEDEPASITGKLLPAKGKLVLTNYRIIFQGTPCSDKFITGQVIKISIPIGGLQKVLSSASARGREFQLKLRTLSSSAIIFSVGSEDIRDGLSAFIKAVYDNDYADFAVKYSKITDELARSDSEPGSPSGSSSPKMNGRAQSPIHMSQSRHSDQLYPSVKARSNHDFRHNTSYGAATVGSPDAEKMATMIARNKQGTISRFGNSAAKKLYRTKLGKNLREHSRLRKHEKMHRKAGSNEHSSETSFQSNPLFSNKENLEKLRLRCCYAVEGNPNFEISHCNANFEQCKSYPWITHCLKNQNNAELVKYFVSGRYPVLSFQTSNGSCLIRSSTLTTRAFNALESRAARGLQSPRDQPAAMPDIPATFATFYKELCDATSRKVLVVMEKKHSVANERQWTYSTEFDQTSPAHRRISIIGVSVVDETHLFKAFKKFDKSVRPHPEDLEKFVRIGEDSEAVSPADRSLFYDSFCYVDIESDWYRYVKRAVHDAKVFSRKLTNADTNVHLCFDNNDSYSCVMTSLVQVLTQPHARTINGFLAIVYRDWIVIGHRFRSSTDRKSMSISPYFLFFLDCVYQIMSLNPGCFHYNSRFLDTVAYHSTSRRFKIFLFDNDRERAENDAFQLDDVTRESGFGYFIKKNQARFSNPEHVSKSTIVELSTAHFRCQLWPFWVNRRVLDSDYFELSEEYDAADKIDFKKADDLNTTQNEDDAFHKREIVYAHDEDLTGETYLGNLLLAKQELEARLKEAGGAFGAEWRKYVDECRDILGADEGFVTPTSSPEKFDYFGDDSDVETDDDGRILSPHTTLSPKYSTTDKLEAFDWYTNAEELQNIGLHDNLTGSDLNSTLDTLSIYTGVESEYKSASVSNFEGARMSLMPQQAVPRKSLGQTQFRHRQLYRLRTGGFSKAPKMRFYTIDTQLNAVVEDKIVTDPQSGKQSLTNQNVVYYLRNIDRIECDGKASALTIDGAVNHTFCIKFTNFKDLTLAASPDEVGKWVGALRDCLQ